MGKEKVKVYLYTRVSTAMQIDGYSLDAQKSRMKAFCEFNEYEIVGEYEDAGKSKMRYLLFLYLNFPDLVEMRLMFSIHFRLCRTLA